MVDALHNYLREEFEMLCTLGVKFSLKTWKLLGIQYMQRSNTGGHSMKMVDARKNMPLQKNLGKPRVQSFIEIFRIVSRESTGKHRMRPEQERKVEVDVAHHVRRIRSLIKYVLSD